MLQTNAATMFSLSPRFLLTIPQWYPRMFKMIQSLLLSFLPITLFSTSILGSFLLSGCLSCSFFFFSKSLQ